MSGVEQTMQREVLCKGPGVQTRLGVEGTAGGRLAGGVSVGKERRPGGQVRPDSGSLGKSLSSECHGKSLADFEQEV